MKRREGKGKGPPSTDLLVCFPTRSNLKLMPNPICSPARTLEPNKHPHHRRHKSINRGSHGGGGDGNASPYLWAEMKRMGSDMSEPTSPKVTCVGQIKVRARPKPGPCENWQSVMKDIEILHKKKTTWVETLGFKKEAMQFLTCLRSIKFDFRCLGVFSNVDHMKSDDDDEEMDHEKNQDQDNIHDHEEEVSSSSSPSSRTVFSKLFMVLKENQDCENEEEMEKPMNDDDDDLPCVQVPSNALLLMRCRSAPAKSLLEKHQEHDDDDDEIKEKENEKKSESLMELMKKYEKDFSKLSCDIAKETWVVGGIKKDPFSRSRSWKR